MDKKFDKKLNRMNDTVMFLIAVLVLLALMGGWWVISSGFEVAAYNRATGKDMSIWDAMFLELRVSEEAK